MSFTSDIFGGGWWEAGCIVQKGRDMSVKLWLGG